MDRNVPSRIVLVGILIVAIAAIGILAARGVTGERQEAPSPSPSTSLATTPTTTAAPVSPTTDSWKSYTVEAAGVRFEYPPAWGTPSVAISPGASGTQYVGRFSGNDSVTFGGNSSDYESGGRGATFYDFYRFIHASGTQYRIQFAPQKYDKYHTVTAAATLTPSEGVEALIVEHQAVSQIFDATDWVAYVNLRGTGKGYEGLAIRYADMPGTESEDLSRLVNSIELAK